MSQFVNQYKILSRQLAVLWSSATQEAIRHFEIGEMHSMGTVKCMLDFYP